MTKKILFLGCSNLVDTNVKPSKEDIWKELVFGQDVEIKNLSWWGAGNQFIAGNCFDYVNDNHVDYVYLQFSGLARYDIPTHDDYNIPNYEYVIKTYKRKYVVSGGKNGSWTGNDRTNQIFLPLYWKDEQYDHIAQESIQACASAIWFLQSKNIQFNWNFFYDITNPATPEEDFYDGHIKQFPSILDKTNWINSDPHTFCFQHNGLLDDKCHFDNLVYKKWLMSVKSQINYSPYNA